MVKIVLSLLIMIFSTYVQVYASQPREIPYAHALSRAISRNVAISPLDREARQLNALARDLKSKYLETLNVDRSEAQVIYGQRLTAIAERDRIQRERDWLVLSVELDLRRHLANIAGYKLSTEVLENSLKLQELALEHVKLRRYHGMAGDLDVSEAMRSLEQSVLDLETLSFVLENERQQLNLLINHPVTANIRILYDVNDFEPLPEEDEVESFVRRQIERDHNLLNRRREVEVRHHEWRRHLYDPTVDRDYTRLQHQLAILERDMAERQAELTVRNALSEWYMLVEEAESLKIALSQAVLDYGDMQNRLDAGMVTQIQVNTAAMALTRQKAELARHNYDFWIARLTVSHPYIR